MCSVGVTSVPNCDAYNGFDSPAATSTAGFPPQYCRVVTSRAHGDDAYVLLDTGPPERAYLYGVQCRREHGKWVEQASGNGSGWTRTDSDPDVGTLYPLG